VAQPVQIRRARIKDCSAIAEVLLQAFLEFKYLYTEGGFAATTPGPHQIYARMKEGPVWVAMRKGIVIGTVAAVKKGESAYVRGMAVLPAVRGAGTGRRLLEHVEKWATRGKAARIFLSTTPFLGSAIRLYEKSGFRRIARGPGNLQGTPLFTMEKIIEKPFRSMPGDGRKPRAKPR
jgi:N-acetylglutamate synthase-like GNAT family acetyltransferase